MSNLKQDTAKRLKMSERAEVQLELHFKGFETAWLWRRKSNAGFTTLPRTLPLAMQAIDAQTKGQPAGHTLFCLWARSPDHPLLTIENPATFASEAGFFGERAVDTWRRRMKQLQKMHFIVAKDGPSGDFHYVLLLNPNVAMEYMFQTGGMQSALYARFIDRVNDIGAQRDIDGIRAHWAALQTARLAAAASPSTEAAPPPPPPPPPTIAGPTPPVANGPQLVVPAQPAPAEAPLPNIVAPGAVSQAAGAVLGVGVNPSAPVSNGG